MEELQQRFAASDAALYQDVVVHPSASDPPQQLVPIASTWRSIRRRSLRITLVVSLALTLAAAYLWITPAQYTASALLLIHPNHFSALREIRTTTDITSISANIESQVELLRSERMLRQVVQSERLVGDPALQPGVVRAALGQLARMVEGQPEPSPDYEEMVLVAARALQRLTSVKRLGITYLVQLEITLGTPQDAARVANGYARSYIDDQRKLNEDFAKRTGEMLRERTQELRQQVRSAAEAVEQFKFSGSLPGHDAASARVILQDLEGVAQTMRVIHDKFLERFAEALQQQHFVIPPAELISPASSPLSRSRPNTIMVLAAAVFIGFLIGTLWALILDRTAQIRRPERPMEVTTARSPKSKRQLTAAVRSIFALRCSSWVTSAWQAWRGRLPLLRFRRRLDRIWRRTTA